MKPIFSIIAALLFSTSAIAADAKPAGYKSDGPIEINADALEVFQEENRAVFTGHVVAIQGDVRLKSEKMNVFYGKGGAENNAIDKIEVTGGVFLSTPEETASGDTGLYDVANRQIHLNSKVVLTRDKNVLKGDKLTYNFATGKSVITGGAAAQNGKKERVRALFVPDKKK